MTIICAHVDPLRQVTWIGSDTLAFHGDIREPFGPKWACHAGWALGAAGDVRGTNVIRRRIAEILATRDAYDISIALRTALTDDGFETEPRSTKVDYGNCYMLACAGQLWTIGSDFSIVEVAEFYAEGSGRELGLGAWHAMRSQHMSGEQAVRAAIAAATTYHVYCGGPPFVRALHGDPGPAASAVLSEAA